ncbi:uncharacterized protein LOC117652031 [Thrips palmi]|uniref:Uncharacterized protein LOC117652031 n=1 Tax=Thrips palmi TaxID=161013 RepID=A0A6P9A5N9_THRPL|nr:uncharacterized protein LOC117652031 [Thrips palmi]
MDNQPGTSRHRLPKGISARKSDCSSPSVPKNKSKKSEIIVLSSDEETSLSIDSKSNDNDEEFIVKTEPNASPIKGALDLDLLPTVKKSKRRVSESNSSSSDSVAEPEIATQSAPIQNSNQSSAEAGCSSQLNDTVESSCEVSSTAKNLKDLISLHLQSSDALLKVWANLHVLDAKSVALLEKLQSFRKLAKNLNDSIKSFTEKEFYYARILTPLFPQLLSLPDDALLAVLAFLPARTLFACRVACRRLRDLCLHRHLWRSVCVESLGVLRAATAALVPCIGRISLDVPLRSTAALLKDTACVVRALELAVQNSQDAALASTLLSEVSAVGGATEIVLLIKCRRPNALQPLLKAVWDRRGLLTLDVTNNSRRPLPSDWCEADGVPSLTRLRYDSPSADPFLELLLRTHAATLQHVELHRLEDVPASLLASALQLRSLKCSPCEGLSKLVDLPDLSSIDLSHESYLNCHCLEAESAAFPRGTLAFLTEASHLRSVTLCVSTEDSEAPLLVQANITK